MRLTALSQRAEIGREEAIERVRGRFISPLQLLDEGELEAGLESMESDLPDRNEYGLEWVVAAAKRP